MSAAHKPMSSPLPAEVDSRAQAFDQLQNDLTKAQLEVGALRKTIAARESELIELVNAFGGSHATKSKILHGIVWEIVATFAQYTSQDSAAVERFRLALEEAKQTRLLKKIFNRDLRWTMKSGAADIIKAEKLSPKLMSLLLQCSVTQDRKPSLDVRPKKKTA